MMSVNFKLIFEYSLCLSNSLVHKLMIPKVDFSNDVLVWQCAYFISSCYQHNKMLTLEPWCLYFVQILTYNNFYTLLAYPDFVCICVLAVCVKTYFYLSIKKERENFEYPKKYYVWSKKSLTVSTVCARKN